MDNRVRHQRIAYYDKEYEQQVQAVTAQLTNKLLANLSTEALKAVASQIGQAWRTIAAKKLSKSKGHYLPRYISGISDVQISGDTVKLRLRSFDAVKIELGWAPPQNKGASIADGIGKYDGYPHDMRPMLLWSGAQPDIRITNTRGNRKKHLAKKLGRGKWQTATRSGAMHWKVIKLELPQDSLRGLTLEVAEWIRARTLAFDGQRVGHKSNKVVDQMRKKAEARAESRAKLWMRKTFRIKEELEESPIGEEAILRLSKKQEAFLPKTATVLWHETMSKRYEVEHRNFLFQRLRVRKTGKSKYSFHLFRTISDSETQIAKQRWFSNGTPPAHIIFGDPDGKDLVTEIARLIAQTGIPTVLKKAARQPRAPAQIKVAAPPTTVVGDVATTQISAGTVRRRKLDPITAAAVVAAATASRAAPTPAASIAPRAPRKRAAPVAPAAPVTPVVVQDEAAREAWKSKMMAEIMESRAASERLRRAKSETLEEYGKRIKPLPGTDEE